MVTVTVSADSSRYDAMDTTTNVSSLGGGAGAGVETDIVYQGAASISRKVTGAGFFTTTGTARNMTTFGRSTWLIKVWLTNYASLATTGNFLEIRCGSDSSNYYTLYISAPGVGEYPEKGGWVIEAWNPGVAFHRDGTTGTPSLTAADFFGTFAQCSTSKVENLCLDAIDVGAGLGLTGGTGADPAGTFQDFIDFDENTSTTGRLGYVTTESEVIYVRGTLTLGATVTEFSDFGRIVVFPDNKAEAYYSGMLIDLFTSGTTIDISLCSFISNGVYYDPTDLTNGTTRSYFDIGGSSGSANFSSCFFVNQHEIFVDANCSFVDCTFISSRFFSAANVTTLSGCSFVEAKGRALDYTLDSNGDGVLDGLSFIRGEIPFPDTATRGETHALYFDPGTEDEVFLRGHSYVGYDDHGPLTFHTETDINSGSDTVTVSGHGYSTGDWIGATYGTGAATIFGFEPVLAVRAVDSNTLAFYDTKGEADADTGRRDINAESPGTGGFITLYSAATAVCNNAGAITIFVLDGGDVPSFRNVNSNDTVTIIAAVTHTVTGLDSGSRVVWIRVSDDVELENKVESAGEATFTYNYQSDVEVDVQILSLVKRNKIIRVTLGNANAVLPAAQNDDPFYDNP